MSAEGIESAEGNAEEGRADEERKEPAEATWFRLFQQEDREREKKYEKYSRRLSEYANDLRQAHAEYSAVEEFRVGDLVQWKLLLKNRQYPHHGKPAIVVEVLDDPITRGKDGERLSEPEDIILGFLDGDQDFMVFPFAKRRFTLWASAEEL